MCCVSVDSSSPQSHNPRVVFIERGHCIGCVLCLLQTKCTLLSVTSFAHSVATGTGMKFVSLEDSVDEVSSSRGHCVSLLTKLGSMVSM